MQIYHLATLLQARVKRKKGSINSGSIHQKIQQKPKSLAATDIYFYRRGEIRQKMLILF
jgi:hypothetical protein